MSHTTATSDHPVGGLYVGCAGFQYDHWRHGAWYPRGVRHERELRYYSQCFATVEVNSTFYGTPSEHTVNGWLESVKRPSNKAEPFLFSLKLRRSITHEEGCLNYGLIERDLASFLERARSLGDHLGPTLIQFPPSFSRNSTTIGALEAFISKWPQLLPCAIEFRHASWYCQETYQFLKQHRMALVIHPMPELPQPPEEITADFMYLRLHGDRVVEHDYDYSDEELAVYAKKIVSWRERGLNVYVFFLNDTSANAPKNALALATQVRLLMGEAPPKLPDDNKISKYFGSTSSSVSTSPGKRPRTEEGGAASPKRPRGDEAGGGGRTEQETGARAGEATHTTTHTSTHPSQPKAPDASGKASHSTSKPDAKSAPSGKDGGSKQKTKITSFFTKKGN